MLVTIPILSGLLDALNPCTVATLILYAYFLFYLKQSGMRLRKYGLVFLVAIFLMTWAWAIGFYYEFFVSEGFVSTIHALCAVLGYVYIVLGFFHLCDWWKLKRGRGPEYFFIRPPSLRPLPAIYWISLSLAALLSFINAVWPINYRMTLLSNNIFVSGLMLETALLFALYCAVYLLPWLAVYLVFTAKRNFLDKLEGAGRLALLKIMHSAVLLSAGYCLFVIF